MRAAPEQVERHLLVGFLQHDNQTAARILPEKIGNSICWIRRKGRLEDQNIGGKFLNSSNRLIEALGLSDNPYVVLEGKDLSQPDAENGLRIRYNHADRAFGVLRVNTRAWLDTSRSADRSAAHPSSFRAYLRGRTARKLPALKTVLINHHTDSTTATIFKAAHHSSAAVDLHVGFCAHNIGGKRKRKIHRRTYRHIGIHAEQDAVGGNILGLDRLPRDDRARHARLVARRRRLQRHRQFYGKSPRALRVPS